MWDIKKNYPVKWHSKRRTKKEGNQVSCGQLGEPYICGVTLYSLCRRVGKLGTNWVRTEMLTTQHEKLGMGWKIKKTLEKRQGMYLEGDEEKQNKSNK
jgi:hypothetical protein